MSDLEQRATTLYEQKFRTQLEQSHLHWFVAIEPDSGEYFLGQSLTEAVQKARQAHPERRGFVLRIGHTATVEVGGFSE